MEGQYIQVLSEQHCKGGRPASCSKMETAMSVVPSIAAMLAPVMPKEEKRRHHRSCVRVTCVKFLGSGVWDFECQRIHAIVMATYDARSSKFGDFLERKLKGYFRIPLLHHHVSLLSDAIATAKHT